VLLGTLDERVAEMVEVAGIGALQTKPTNPRQTDELEENARDLARAQTIRTWSPCAHRVRRCWCITFETSGPRTPMVALTAFALAPGRVTGDPLTFSTSGVHTARGGDDRNRGFQRSAAVAIILHRGAPKPSKTPTPCETWRRHDGGAHGGNTTLRRRLRTARG